MIPDIYLQDWRAYAPWTQDVQVEQDLIICRSLVEIYSDDYLSDNLALRGGTALNKLFFHPQCRYSEDIDLVQLTAAPIKATYDHLRDALSFLGEPKIKQNKNNNTLIFRLSSDTVPQMPMRIKVEINCKEHFSVMPLSHIPFSVDNRWFSGSCQILSYQLDELIGTKLRALYQRRKGRDLFDIYKALTSTSIDEQKVIACYMKYMNFVVDHIPSYKEFLNNINNKLSDNEFIGDTAQLLRSGENFSPHEAFNIVRQRLLDLLPHDKL